MRSSQLGPENCTATVAILSNTVTVYDATFLIGNSPVSEGSVVNGTLVVFDTESVFSTPTNVRCGSGGVTNQVSVEYTSK